MSKQDDNRASNKTDFYASGMKTTTPGTHSPGLDETKAMETIDEPKPNTIRYNEPTTSFQILLLNLFRSNVAKLDHEISTFGTPEITGKALAELVKAANPEARGFFNSNYDAAFQNPDALFHAYVGLEPALDETFNFLNKKKIKKKVATNNNGFSYDSSFKGVETKFHLSFGHVTADDADSNHYSKITGYFQKMRQVAGGSLGGMANAYEVIQLKPVTEGSWRKKRVDIPNLEAMTKDPKGYYNEGGIFLLSDIIHVEQRLRPEDAVKAIAQVNNNYERRNWILTELLALPKRLKEKYS